MGTKVQRESLLLLGYHSMRDLNEDSSGCSWPFYYGDKQNGQFYNGFVSRPMADTYFGYEKDVVRRTMLEHEAIFKSQVYELHRLYRIQRDMMDEFKRKELSRNRIPIEASFSSSLYDDTRKWQMPSFPLVNSVYDKPSMSVVEDNGHSPISSRKGSNSHVGSVPSQNGISSKDIEPLEIRPVKVRKKMIDLHLPADEYIDTDEIDNRINGGLMKAECRTDSLNISSDFRNSNGLADLNEPINVQEINGFAIGYPHGECEGQDLCDGRKIPSISSIKEGSFNPGIAKEHLSVISLHSDKNGNHFGTGKMSDYSGVHKSVPSFLRPIKTTGSSQTNNSRDVVGFPQSGPRKITSWRDRTFIDLEADTSNQEIINQNRLESNDRCLQSSGSVGQWNHLHSSRGNPRFDGFPHKAVTSVEIHPFHNVSDTMNGGNSKKQGYLMNSWSNQNGFYHGSSSASKEQQSNLSTLGYSSLNGRSNLSSTNVYRDSNGSEMKPVRDVNLNVTDLNEEKGNPGTLPWLNSEPDGQQRDLGRPRFYEPCSYGDQLNGGNGKMLDINIPSDKDLSTEYQTGFRCQIDLNMSVIEEEHCSVSLGSRLNSKVAMIDLESLPIPESDEDCVYEENSLEEHEKIAAADAIVAISQAFHSENTLQWFAETIHVHGENLDQKLDTLVNNGKVDYFELMTLQLPEVNEDEYMPKPLVPEDLKFDEPSGPTLVHGQRPRRGNARRGRQRRDFQRDILPGLVSLSRHEMTEDIQTFDGLMKAMGVTWISSLTRRKTGSNQGRRRLVPPTTAANPIYCPSPSVQQNNNNNNNNNNDMKTGFEDKSLTSWGNMTRRPRRQRCPPAGNRSHTPYA